MKPIHLYGGLVACALSVLIGCAGSSQPSTVWSDPVAEPNSLHKIMVVDVEKNPTIRRLFEDRFSAVLKAQGIDAVPSYPLVGDAELDSTNASMEMHKRHCDGVFVVRVLDQKTVNTYYPPTTSYRPPPPHFGGWYSYYSRGYAYLTSPGYTVETQLVNMETVLYRVSDGSLVWSALSQAWRQPSDIPGDEVNPVVAQIARAISSASIVARSTER